MHRREQHFGPLDPQMFTVIVDLLSGQQAAINFEEFVRDLVALTVIKKNAVAFVLYRIAAGHHID